MGTPHKHAELIKAWADGADIQTRLGPHDNWRDCGQTPGWTLSLEYRIKPEPKPDIKRYALTGFCNKFFHIGGLFENPYEARPKTFTSLLDNTYTTNGTLRLTFDGETKKLKKVEMIDE